MSVIFLPVTQTRGSRFVVMALLALPCLAYAAPEETLDLLELPLEKLLTLKVSTASKFEQPLTDAPSSVTVITAADIKSHGWRTLADALSSVRGLYVSNDGNYSYLGGRGFARPGDYNTRFLLLVDGVRSNDAIYDQASIGREFPVDIDLIERIEYAPGPGSSIYGSNAFFGVVNIITKSGDQFIRPEGSVRIGSAGERKARASYGIRDKNGAQFLLSATTFRRKGTDQYYPEFDAPNNNFGVAQGLDHERGGNVFLKAAMGPFIGLLTHNERERGIPTASYSQVFNDPRSRTKDTQTLASLSYRTDLNDETRLTARAFWGALDYKGAYAYAAPDKFNLDGSKSSWAGTEISVLNTALRNHKILGGIEYQRDYRRDQFATDEYPPGSPDAPVFSNAAQRFTVLNDKRAGTRAGIYLQDEISLREDLLANVGVRYDYNSEVSGAISPRLALIYRMTPATTLKAISGSAFRAPNAFEMFYNLPGEGGQKANTELKSERIRSQELMLEHLLSHDARFQVSVFRNQVSRLISQTEDPDGLLVYRNLSKATARGVELQYEQAWRGGMRFRGSQSWQEAEDEAGVRLINSPRSLTKLNLVAPLWHALMTAGLEARYTGRRATKNGTLGGFWLVNATLFSARLIDQTELSFSIFNLFDKRYSDPGAEEHLQDSIPQEGRAFLLGVSRSF